MPLTNRPDADSRTKDIITVVAVETTFTLLIVVGRVLVKLRMTTAPLWWDDWLMMLAMVMSILHGAHLLAQMPYGFGHHIYDLAPDVQVRKAIRIFYFGQIDYFAIVGVIKMSILFFYLRLSRSLRPAIYALMVFVCGVHISCTLVAIFQCTPIRFDWDESIEGGHCVNRTAFYYSNAALNIVSDLIIYILPMKTLWDVQIPKKQRIGLLLVFAFGGFVVIVGILRLESLKTASVTKDPTWDNVAATLYTETEFNVGIICGCLPCLKPLFMRVLGHKNGSKGSTSGGLSLHGGVVNRDYDRFDEGEPDRSRSQSSVGPTFEAYEAKVMGSAVSAGPSDSVEMINTKGYDAELGMGGIRKTTDINVTRD